MKNYLLFIIFTFIYLCSYSQTDVKVNDSLVIVVLTNGESKIGRIVKEDSSELILKTENLEEIILSKKRIASITTVHEFQPEVVALKTYTISSRYFVTHNSLPLRKRDNYLLLNLYGPEVQFALSKRFSCGAIATWNVSPVILSAKYLFPTKNEKINFGLTSLIGSTGYINAFRGYGGMQLGMFTYGDSLKNFTFSAGYSFLQTGFKKKAKGLKEEGVYPALQDPYDPEITYFIDPFGINLIYYGLGDVNDVGTGLTLGLSGTSTINSKTSFVFESMFILGKQVQNIYTQTFEEVRDPITGQPSYTEIGPAVRTNVPVKSILCYIMPGLRFQKGTNHMFQFALAGVLFKTMPAENIKDQTFILPFPALSYFRKL